MKTINNRFTEVCQLDVCLPDYFSGYHMPVIAVPMYNGITNKELAKDIKSEINATWEYLCNEDSPDQSFTEKEMRIFDRFCNKLKRAKKYIIIENLEESEEEDTETVYMYLSLCKPVHQYGMTFLNA